MALWGKTDAAASAPKFTGLASNGAIANTLFGGARTGVFGVDAAESQYARATTKKPVTQGWVLQQYGTGPVLTIAPNVGGSGYVNTQVVTLSNSVKYFPDNSNVSDFVNINDFLSPIVDG